METEKVTIEAERIGLPATASAADIRDGVYALAKDRDKWKADAEKWKERAEENQTALIEAKKDSATKKELEGRIVIQAARDAKKITKKDEDFYLQLYKTNPEMCIARLDSLEEQRYLERQDSIKGEIAEKEIDPLVDLSIRVAEIRANNDKLTEAQAVQIAYRKDPKLFQRVTEARREKAGTKGGTD